MSRLRLATTQGKWELNVLTFSSPIHGTISTAQTKMMAHHYPIKCTQPEIQFSVVFPNEQTYESFQRFVRAHQQDALKTTRLVWLDWPERNINNWTGVIRQFKAGGMRFNPAPHATFVVDLVDSMVSARTDAASLGPLLWRLIYGAGMGPDSVLGAPTLAEQESFYNNPLYRNGLDWNSGGTDAPVANPSQPGAGPFWPELGTTITAGG